MSKKDSYLNNTENRERLVLTGLAAEREPVTEPCPEAERFAEFLEANPASPEQQGFVDHLAACETCRQKWLVLSEELSDSGGLRTKTTSWLGHRGLLGLVGSACALAAGVMLYLAIDYRPATFNFAGSPAPERAQEEPADQEVDQVEVADSDVLARKKSRIEKLAEADTSEPGLEVVSDRKESRVLMSVESAPKPASAPAKALSMQTSSKKAGPPEEKEGFSAKADALEFQESPVDQALDQIVVTDSDVLPRKKSRVEKLAEADTAEPGLEVVLDRKEFREQMSAELPKNTASAPAESLGKRANSTPAGPMHDEEEVSSSVGALKFDESLKLFMDSVSSLCEDREESGDLGADLTNTAELGLALLELEKTTEIPNIALLKEIVQLLAQKEPVKDTELDKLCTQATRVAVEMNKAINSTERE